MEDSKLENKKIIPLLIELSIPAMVGLIINAIYNVVDRMFIGNSDLGSLGLAGITISYPVTLVLMAFGLMCGIGGSTLFSISSGAKEESEARIYQGNSLVLGIFFGLCFTIFGNIFLSPLLKILGASNQVLPYAKLYLRIILFGAVFQCVTLCGNNLSRAQGNANNTMISQILGGVFNIIFDYIFIIRMHMGMQGAALATIGGQFLSMVWQLAFLFGKRSLVPIQAADLKPHFKHMFLIMKTGTPSFLLQCATSVLNIVINSTLVTYGGDIAVSSVGIITSVQTLMLMPLTGLTHGQQPIVSYNYGAKRIDRVKETLKCTNICATIFAIIEFIIIQCFASSIISLFNNETEIITLGTKAIHIWFLCFPFVGCQMMCANFFISLGKVAYSSFLNLLRQCILLIPLILILSTIIGLYGIFIAVPIADTVSFIVTATLCLRFIKKLGENDG
ncbi:MAG: MATE family efflux transporter [Erysipelotrichaceae bacterium]|nr:MATE family efflux transporter [Erysipelotrichaceae bacterium]